MSYADLAKKLPDGLKSKVIQAAHALAERKWHEATGGSAQYGGEKILFYTDETWKEAWLLVNPRKDWVHERLMELPVDSRYYWCGSWACACMGCANISGVTKDEHAAWVKENPKPPESEKEPFYFDFLSDVEKKLASNGYRMQAIKEYRLRTGASLKSARETVDVFIQRRQ